MELNETRKQIDAIDEQMTDLFCRRMELALEIAEAKKEQHLPVLNHERERKILQMISAQAGEPLDKYARLLFNTLFDVSRSYQNNYLAKPGPLANEIRKAVKETPEIFPGKAVVACQGVSGSYSAAACEKLFTLPSPMFFNTFESVFNAVDKGLCAYGILPIENSSYGSVSAVYDLMRNYNFHIVRSIRLRVSHNLLARPGTSLSDIKEIYSHEQAIGQCGEFLKTLPGVKITLCDNTAEAAKLVAGSDRTDAAAIASRECVDLYGLDVLKSNIQITDNNYTRFICISKKLEIYPGANRISLMLSLEHKPSSLYHMIARFSSMGLNLTKLESRPIPGSDFEFMFYFDIDAPIYSEEVIGLLSELEEGPETFVFLGSYSEAI